MEKVLIVMDVDLTVTEEYQQIPLIREFMDKIHAAYPDKVNPEDPYSYLNKVIGLGSDLKGDKGMTWLQAMLGDMAPGRPLEGVTLDDLLIYGSRVKPAKGLKEGLVSMKKEFEDEAEIDFVFLSVGIHNLVKGFKIANGLTDDILKYFFGSWLLEENGRITGISDPVTPYKKNQYIEGLVEGNHGDILNIAPIKKSQNYRYDNVIVVGDGFSDYFKFENIKRKGGTAVLVYGNDELSNFDKSEGLFEKVDLVVPRDYTPGSQTYDAFVDKIKKILSRSCKRSKSIFFPYKEGSLESISDIEHVEGHVKRCDDCLTYFDKVIIGPTGKKTKTNSFPNTKYK